MRLILITILLLASFSALAKDSVQLNFVFKANSTFAVQMETTSDMKMIFEGDKENIPVELRNRFPGKILSKSILEEKINTGEKSLDSSYPLELFVQKQKKYFSFNNSEMIEDPSKLGNLEGVRLQGLARADGSIQFISIHGSKAGNELEPIAKAIFAQLGNTNSFFAGKIIQVGEVITHRTPMQIPLKDDGKMSFEMETQYTLKSIEGDIASFDVNYSALVGAEVEAANINIQLIGDGKMTYSISNQYAPEATSNFSAQMNIPIYGGILKNVSTNRSRTVISYESKQTSQRTAQ